MAPRNSRILLFFQCFCIFPGLQHLRVTTNPLFWGVNEPCVPFREQHPQNLNSLSPKRDCSPKRVNVPKTATTTTTTTTTKTTNRLRRYIDLGALVVGRIHTAQPVLRPPNSKVKQTTVIITGRHPCSHRQP